MAMALYSFRLFWRSNVIFFVCLLLVGTSRISHGDYRVPSEHPPRSSAQGSGVVTLGNFDYFPHGLEAKAGRNQYCNIHEEVSLDTMQGGPSIIRKEYCVGINEIVEINKEFKQSSRIRFDNSIESYFTKALHNELKFIGYNVVPSSNIEISGKILKCWIDKTSSNTTKIIFEIDYYVKDLQLGTYVYNVISNGEFIFTDGEHIDIPSSVYSAASRAIENFINSAQGAGVLGY